MYRRTAAPVLSKALLDAWLAALTARPAAALLTTPFVVLYSDGPALTPTADVTAYTVATFHGYANVSPTFAVPGNLASGDQGLPAQCNFNVTSGGTLGAQNIKGYLLTDGANAFYMGEEFPTPVSFAAVGDFLDLDIVVPVLCRPGFAV